MGRLSYQRQCVDLESEAAKFAAAARDPDPSSPVPTCPDWTLAQLTAHVHRGIHWAATMVERRTTTPMRATEVEAALPTDPDERAEALRAGAARLATAVHESGPSAHVWSWAEEQTAGFWLGRMLHETLVHRIDAQLASGHDPAGIDVPPDLAADCVADMLMVAKSMSARSLKAFAALPGTGQTLLFLATDDGLGQDGAWLVRREPAGVTWTWGTGSADVAVRGSARDLMLVLTRRIPVDHQLEVEGDSALLTHWLTNSRL